MHLARNTKASRLAGLEATINAAALRLRAGAKPDGHPSLDAIELGEVLEFASEALPDRRALAGWIMGTRLRGLSEAEQFMRLRKEWLQDLALLDNEGPEVRPC